MFKQKLKTPISYKRGLLLVLPVVIVMASFVVVLGRLRHAEAATNSTINYQARLLTSAGKVVLDGIYNVEFKLYDVSSGGAALWTETRTGSNRVRTVNGYLTVNLGSVNAFGNSINWDQELWLTMNIGDTDAVPDWDGEMSPRLKLTSVPYAFRAGSLVGGSGANTTTLNTGTPSGNNTISLPAESGTLCIQNSANCGFALSSGSGNYIQNGTSLQTANFYIQSAANNSVGGIIRGASGQTSSLFQLLDGSSGLTVAQFTNNGYLHLGSDSISRTGQIVLHDGTTSNSNTATLIAPTALTGNRTLTLPDETGTLCIQSSTNCGFALSTGSGNYIQNTTTVQAANFAVRSNATASVAGIIQGANGQSVDIFRVQTWNGTTATSVLTVGSTGLMTVSAGLTATGTIQVNASSNNNTSINTGTSTGTVTIGGGSAPLAIDSTNFDVSSAGAVSGVTTLTTSGAINGQTISSAANFTGTVTIQGGSSLTLGTASSNTGSISFKGSGGTGTLTLAGPTTPNAGNFTLSIPAITANANVCTDNSICSGYAAASGSGNYIQNGTTVQTANFAIRSAAIGSVAGVIQGANGQTADIFQLQTWNGTSATNVLAVSNVGLVTASAGLTVSGGFTATGTVQVNASSNNNTSINTGTSTGTVTIGGGSAPLAIDSTNFDVSTAGAVSGVTTLTTSGAINGQTISSAANFTGTVTIQGGSSLTLGTSSSNTGSIIFRGSGGAGTLTLAGPTTPNVSNFTVSIPAVTANATICTDNAVCTGYAPASGSGNYIQNGTTVQTANFAVRSAATGSVTGVIQGANGQTADIFQVQTWNGTTATTRLSVSSAGLVTAGAGLTVTGALSQSTGTISLAATGSASYTSSGSTTITAGGASTWSTSSGSLTVQAATTNTLNLQTGGAGTVTLGDQNTTTINIGRGSNIARTINIGTAGTSTAQAITVGSTGGTSSTTIQGGTGSTAINLTTGTNGSINLTVSGTGDINLNSADTIIAKATNSIQFQNASNAALLYVDTSAGRVGVGGQATFSKFEVIGGDAAVYNNGNNPRLVLGDSTAGGENGYLQWDSASNYFRIESVGTNGLKVNDNYVAIGNLFPDQPLKIGNGSTLLHQITTTGSALYRTTTNSATGFQVQDTNSNNVFNVDTSAAEIELGKASTTDGKLVFFNAANANTVSIQSGVTSTGYTLTLPTALGNAGDCLKDGGSGALQFTACGNLSGSLQGAYNSSIGSTTPEIIVDSSRAGVDIQDVSTPGSSLGTSPLFAVRGQATSSTLGAKYFSVQGDGRVAVGNITASYALDVSGDINISSGSAYKINGTNICTASGCTPASGSSFYIQNQNSSQQSSSNFWISGNGRVDGYLQSAAVRAVTNGTTAIQLQNAGGTASAMNVDTTNNRVSIGNAGTSFAPQETLDVAGNIQVRDSSTTNRALRLNSSSSFGIEGAGANMNISVWSAANFTGTQRNYLVLESAASNVQAINTWQWRTAAGGTTRHTLDGSTGTSVAFNQNGEATNFSVQGDTDANAFFVQGSTDRVGIGTNTPGYKLDVAGDVNISSASAYKINGTNICTSSGCTASSASAILNQSASQQTSSSFWISTSGRADTSFLTPLLDTPTGVTLNVGGTATAISLNENTTVTGTLNANGNTTIGDANTDTLTLTAVLQGGSPIVLEGAAADASELTLAVASLTADRTITLPDETGTVCLQGATSCGFASNLQTAYTLSAAATPEIVLDTTRGALTLRQDLAGSVTTLFEIQNNGGGTSYFSVNTNGITSGGYVTTNDNVMTAATFRSNDQTAASTASANTNFVSGQTSGTNSNTGTVLVRSGHATVSGNTGNTTVSTGNATSGNSGSVTIDVGTASGTTGSVNIANTNASALNIGKTASNITTTVNGLALFKTTAADSANALRVQDAASNNILRVATDTDSVYVGSASNEADLIMSGDITWGATLGATQGFESNVMPPTDAPAGGTWTRGGNVNWINSTSEVHGGNRSSSNGNISDNQTSWLDLNYTFTEDGTISFYWMVSSESSWDWLLFCVDNDSCTSTTGYNQRISGSVAWTKVTVPVTAGAHSFRWVYSKDDATSTGSDTGWIDDIEFTGGSADGNIHASSLTFSATDSFNFDTASNDDALTIDVDGLVGINTSYEATEALTVEGNFNVRNTSTLTKQYRFRTNGAALDLEAGGADLYISNWTNADFSGTQTTHMILDNGTGSMRFPSLLDIPTTGYTNLCVQNTSNREIRRGTSATTCAPSSLRFKDNVSTMPETMGIEAIMALRPVTFSYKADPTKKQSLGFIAEEVDRVLPQLVNRDDSGLIQSLDYEFMVANLVKGIQQQQSQINSQQGQINQMRIDIDNLRRGVWNGGLVANDTTFNNLVTFNGGVNFKSDVAFEGNVNFKKKVTYSEDTAGTIVIPEGQTKIEVKFKEAYANVPRIALSADQFVTLKVTNKTVEGFTISLRAAYAEDVIVDWVATQTEPIAAKP